MVTLGAERVANGEKSRLRPIADCITYEARRQIASLGIITLERIPTKTRRGDFVTEPICSSQPPMKASPCRPSTMTPFVSVENHVPKKNVVVSSTKHSR